MAPWIGLGCVLSSNHGSISFPGKAGKLPFVTFEQLKPNTEMYITLEVKRIAFLAPRLGPGHQAATSPNHQRLSIPLLGFVNN